MCIFLTRLYEFSFIFSILCSGIPSLFRNWTRESSFRKMILFAIANLDSLVMGRLFRIRKLSIVFLSFVGVATAL